MGIYVTGDLHIETDFLFTINKLNDEFFPAGSRLSKKDYVIICGDTGLVWDNSEHEQFWKNWLNERNFTTLFVDGNHENFPELYKYPVEEWKGGKIHKITDSIYHLMRGQVFTIQGKKFFTFGGAKSVDDVFEKHYKEELPTTEEMQEGINNLKRHNNKVDFIITHCCDSKALKTVSEQCYFAENCEVDILNEYFTELDQKVKYKHWYFGHYHWDISNVEQNKTALYENVIKIV